MWFESWEQVVRVLLLGSVSDAALVLLASLQFIVAWLSARWPRVGWVVNWRGSALPVNGTP